MKPQRTSDMAQRAKLASAVHTFEIEAFPDLAISKYHQRFGPQLHSIVTSRLASWLRVLSSTYNDTGYDLHHFVLRYRFDPNAAQKNKRLRIEVVVRASLEDLGETTVTSAIPFRRTTSSPLSDGEAGALFVLGHSGEVETVTSGHYFLPDRWQRNASARQALEPFLDEIFDTLTDPAFLDIHLRPFDGRRLSDTLHTVVSGLERDRDGPYRLGAERIRERYRHLIDDLAPPIFELVVVAGSKNPLAARRLLSAYAVESTGAAAIELIEIESPNARKRLLSMLSGEEFFQPVEEGGWCHEDTRQLAARSPNAELSQLTTQMAVLAGMHVVQDLLTLPIPVDGLLRTFPLETEAADWRRRTAAKPESSPDRLILGHDLDRTASVSLATNALTKHAFVAGVTGSGKSTTMFNVLRQLAEQKVPFIVFEPAKTEYRVLCEMDSWLRRELAIYTPGKERLSPIRLNPFEFPAGISLTQHVASVVSAFRSGLSLWEPLPSILERAIWKAFDARGWSEEDEGDVGHTFPTLRELWAHVEVSIQELGYDAENTGRITGALKTRLLQLTQGSVGRFFDAPHSLPKPADLFSKPCVFELAGLSSEQINLATLFFVNSLREYLTAGKASTKLKLVLVLEEAHNLIPAQPARSAEGESLVASEVARYFTNLLAEMRSLGLGVIVVDQTPSAVSPFVLKGTDLKIFHRTVAREDREVLANSTLMTPEQQNDLGRLAPGQAFVYHEGLYRPAAIAASLVEDIPGPMSDLELSTALTQKSWWQSQLQIRTQGTIKELSEAVEFADENLRALQSISDKADSDHASDIHLLLDANSQSLKLFSIILKRALADRHNLEKTANQAKLRWWPGKQKELNRSIQAAGDVGAQWKAHVDLLASAWRQEKSNG